MERQREDSFKLPLGFKLVTVTKDILESNCLSLEIMEPLFTQMLFDAAYQENIQKLFKITGQKNDEDP